MPGSKMLDSCESALTNHSSGRQQTPPLNSVVSTQEGHQKMGHRAMTNEQFANAMLEEARRRGLLTSRGNIMCSHDKCISRRKLTAIHRRCGSACVSPSTKDFKAVKIESCCFKVFKLLARSVYRGGTLDDRVYAR